MSTLAIETQLAQAKKNLANAPKVIGGSVILLIFWRIIIALFRTNYVTLPILALIAIGIGIYHLVVLPPKIRELESQLQPPNGGE